MAHAFKKIPAKPTFGALKPNLYQSDYITNKKAKIAFCDVNNVSNYNQLNLYNRGKYLNSLEVGNISSFDKSDLIFGLYSKMDLTNVCSVINGPPCNNIDSCIGCDEVTTIDISSSSPFYFTNTIDPVGELFGNTTCGTNNFINYMVYN